MSLRSPLGRVLGQGSAKYGAGHWQSQRVTAVALVLLGAWFVSALVTRRDLSHESVTAWLRSPAQAILAVLFVLTAARHAALGLQVILEDYVGNRGVRIAAVLAVQFVLVVAAAVGVLAVMWIVFGATA